jgi:hypothetical protein
MTKIILMDEFHLTVFANPGLPPAAYRAIRQTLVAAHFRKALRHAIQVLLGRQPSLKNVRFTVTQ